jgi:hypothetical protein
MNMFNLLKRHRPAPASVPIGEPHPQHRNFVRISIPDTLTRHRSGFLYAISTPQGSQILQETWQKSGAVALPKEMLLPPSGLSVSCFRHEKHVCFLIIFPQPQTPGESFFGFIVAGPTEDWSPEARAKVPARYFILERSKTSTPEILEWRPSSSTGEELFDPLGPGPSPQDPRKFVEAILSQFYGLK